jgi:hypothetical protein
MPLFDEHTQVFIVRIWREPREIEGAAPEWRGVIEHVPDGKRRYLKNLAEVTDFIAPYLEQLGVELDIRQRVRQWLNQWKRRSIRRK